ncbi:DUF4406 domain-containing protein [Budviciaceae bacterium CWB-B4]|uniref:DUF4406 domain-containing protein n=1 Tax=Limnobaculum xujianqingii TaxID=2738837 RepID=A0A9D7AGV0_9GAMM|nr:DUF4406 domain-containing protein [Limnobaculum xujianqingii]MBK5072547.1 DUF4406 domain-containing protein [Limnobaculum xujianqingii]MBK5175856.1 DUF4406 domain-containing protein [Limnobaculum xujianqingii]
MTPVIFISGPMTGKLNFNRQAFNAAAARLKDEGFIVLNPAIQPDGLTHDQYMVMSLAMLEQSDAIYLLKGWENSKGAVMEYDRAKQRDLLFMYEDMGVFRTAAARSRRQHGKEYEENLSCY